MTDYQPKSDFLRTIMERGFFHQCTDLVGLDARLLAGTPVSAYIGFDATADSLHVGSLMQIMMLRWLQKCGHRPIILMGGGTTKVGDPSGKDETRKLLSKKNIDSNIEGIRSIFDKYISFDNGSTGAIQLNNADWLDSLKYVEFLRDIGRHFTINRMMTMESVKARLDREQPLTFLEFNYMLLQSYDFLELHQREGCLMQIGGSDQWGNIVNGIDLIRRINGAQVFGLTSPLLTKADGSKMGKTASGAIWLNEDEDDDNDEDEIYEVALNTNKLSPYDFWQFWRNTMDEDVGRFLKLFTELPLDECERLSTLQGEEINEAKIILANEVCALCHGEEKTKKAEATAKAVFEEGGKASGLITRTFNEAIDLTQLLVDIGFAKSGKEAKRMIASGAVKINDVVMEDTHRAIGVSDSSEIITTKSINDILSILEDDDETVVSSAYPSLLGEEDNTARISVGKKRHAIVKFN